MQLQLATDTHITDINITLMEENKRPLTVKQERQLHGEIWNTICNDTYIDINLFHRGLVEPLWAVGLSNTWLPTVIRQ